MGIAAKNKIKYCNAYKRIPENVPGRTGRPDLYKNQRDGIY